MKTIASILFVAAAGGIASANGFLLNEFDARSVGRGNASTASDTEASSIYYNVGGMAAGDGTQISIAASLIEPRATYTDAQTKTSTDSTTSPQVVPGIFATTHITDMLAVGFGFYTPFGLANDWPTTSPQANVATEVALRTYFMTPSVGLNLGSFVPGLSVGGGVDLVPATIELKQAVYLGNEGTGCGGATPTCAHLGGTAFGVGMRFGALYQHPSGKWGLGAMWRSDIQLDFDGDADFDAPETFRAMLPADGITKTSLHLPQQFSGGIAWRPAEGLEVEANIVWTEWSKLQSLAIEVPNPPSSGGTMTISSPLYYEDTTTVRMGTEYTSKTLGAALRGGIIWDPTPVPTKYLSVLLPDIDRVDLTLGASKSFGSSALHVGLLWVLPRSRSTVGSEGYQPAYKGTYDVQAFVASVSYAAKLGK